MLKIKISKVPTYKEEYVEHIIKSVQLKLDDAISAFPEKDYTPRNKS